MQQVPRRRSPQQIAVIQPRSIWQRAVTSRGSRCHAAALAEASRSPRGTGAALHGSALPCPGRMELLSSHFPSCFWLSLGGCWSHSRVTSLFSELPQRSRPSHASGASRWEGLCQVWVCFHGETAALGRIHQVSVASCWHRCEISQ